MSSDGIVEPLGPVSGTCKNCTFATFDQVAIAARICVSNPAGIKLETAVTLAESPELAVRHVTPCDVRGLGNVDRRQRG